MTKKEEYIAKEIKRREDRIESTMNGLIASQKHAIELLKNLSDEEFKSIQEKKTIENEKDVNFNRLLEKAGVLISEIDEVEEVSDEVISKLKTNLSDEDFAELTVYLSEDK